MILTPAQLRADDTLGGRAAWLDAPSTMFDLLVRADARDGSRRAELYYQRAMSLALATAALDLVPSPDEVTAIETFRGRLLAEMDAARRPTPRASRLRPGPRAGQALPAPLSTPLPARPSRLTPSSHHNARSTSSSPSSTRSSGSTA